MIDRNKINLNTLILGLEYTFEFYSSKDQRNTFLKDK